MDINKEKVATIQEKFGNLHFKGCGWDIFHPKMHFIWFYKLLREDCNIIYLCNHVSMGPMFMTSRTIWSHVVRWQNLVVLALDHLY